MDPAPVCAPSALLQRIIGGVGSSWRQSRRLENHRLAGWELSLGMTSLDIQMECTNADLSDVGVLVGTSTAADARAGAGSLGCPLR